MRYVAGWLGALWLVVGCTVPEDAVRACSTNADCGADGACDQSVGLCYAKGTEPELPSATCSPVCAAYEVCTTTGCRPRFTELKILTPAASSVLSTATAEVAAQLVVNPSHAATTQLPETLLFSAVPGGSSGDEVGSFSSVTRNGNTYTAVWAVPAAQGPFTLKVAHPTAGAVQGAEVNVQVDRLPPDFTIAFTPPNRSAGTDTIQADQRDPTSGYETAFRRDETVTVRVTANEPVGNVTLTVKGIGADGNPGQAQPAVTIQPVSTCPESPPFCGTATVDFSVPEMRAVRGTMELQVEGQDNAGNRGAKNAQVKVTRWKWAFNAGGNILGTPAIGNKGTIYFGTGGFGNGRAYAMGPDGDKLWEYAAGDVSGSPAVGAATSNNEEYVYIAARSGGSSPRFYALHGSNGSEKGQCPVSGSGSFQGALAVGMVMDNKSEARETGVGIYNTASGRVIGIRPDAASSPCIEISGGVPRGAAGGALVMKDVHIFYPTEGAAVASYDLDSGSSRVGWPQSTNHQARGLTLLGNTLYGGAGGSDNPPSGSLFKIPTAGGGLSVVYPATGSSRVFNLSIGSGNVAYFGAETGSDKSLASLALDSTGAAPRNSLGAGTLRGAPVVGRNDRLYTLNTEGRVTAWTASTLTPQWSVELVLDLSAVDASPTLDCHRDASGQGLTGRSVGTLYFGGGTRLYALVVDSPGLDPNSPWPKYQHDARNTGNPATPITNCP
jgi:outer membrane protein assembly factor BamB